ncbi:MAG: DUF1592 domain-containing protein [Pirellulaceae bacterium]|nr:DUF1592 domain-containing protein [Pirellulaceae bacterium]
MARITYTTCIATLYLCAFARATPPEARLPEKHRAFFKSHCLDCHDSETREGNVDLEKLPFRIATIEQAELWQKVLNALNAGEMPPEDSEQPGNTEKTDFLDDLARTMVIARQVLADSGGKITMRRLNRREYRNTIRHLLGVYVNVESLPADGGSGTFDTTGASLFLSSDQFEKYLKLGRIAIDEVFERRTTAGRKPMLFRFEPEETVNVGNERQIKNMEEEHERFMRWKAGVDKAAATPENLAKIAELSKTTPRINNPTRFYYYANLLEGTPDPKDFGFRDAQRAAFSHQGGYLRKYPYFKHYAALPHNDRGAYLKLAWGVCRFDISPPPKKLPSGTYIMRVRAGVVEGSPSSRHFIEIGHPQRRNGVRAGFAGFPLSSHQITGTIRQPEIVETQLEISAHTQREFGIQERQPTNTKSLRNAYNRDKRNNGYGTDPAIWIDWIELEGPQPEDGTPSPLRTILSRHPSRDGSEAERARAIFTEFTNAAFRGEKPEETFIDKLLAIFEVRRKAGDPFDVAIRTPLSVILASPGFLYLNEPGNETERRELNDHELAVRLAYFLWSAPPDRQLLDLAERNELHRPRVLREQVNRLIADSSSDEFVSGFVHQWLNMERLDFFQFDANLHRDFDENVRAAAREEVYQSFAHLLRGGEDNRLDKLLKSDYVFINGLLANYYGIDGVTGDAFRKIKLPADSVRGGLLGMAAIHAMGSDGVVSSPVERGAWVLRYLLNDPPPPAPPNVPQLSRLKDQLLTTRERLLTHQAEAQCASCHRKIDPIGFGLENFNAAGKWRTTDSYQPAVAKKQRAKKGKSWEIDVSGAFHQGPVFGDYHELRELIAEREEDFARGFTQHLIEYALGRPFGFTDADLANEIANSARSKQFAVSEFVHSLVQSEAFRTK